MLSKTFVAMFSMPLRICTQCMHADRLALYNCIFFLFRAMPCNPKQSLVLFDWDGYTAILNSSRIQRTGRLGGPLFVSCRGTLSYDGRLHKVEVLQLSGKFCFD